MHFENPGMLSWKQLCFPLLCLHVSKPALCSIVVFDYWKTADSRRKGEADQWELSFRVTP